MKSSSWSQDRKVWTCTLNRGGKEMTLTTHHLLFAMGAGSFVPQTPDIPGRVSPLNQIAGVILKRQ